MKDIITIDLLSGELERETDKGTTRARIDKPDGFKQLSDVWLRSGWQNKHVYTFTWFGRPIIQLPEDIARLQELICDLRPDVIVETGVAHGGSLIFYASLFEAMNNGHVIGIDIEIRPHNRKAIEAHLFAHRITLLEGDSTNPLIVDQVEENVGDAETVLVILDSNHTYEHVLSELHAYSPLVSKGSYIIATDGLTKELAGLDRHGDDRYNDDWTTNNPQDAVKEFLKTTDIFELHYPPFQFNESPLQQPVTYFQGGWLRRKRSRTL